MTELSTQIARAVVGEYSGPLECPWCSVHHHRDACTFECAEARGLAEKHAQRIKSAATLIDTELVPVMEVVRKAVRHSHIVGIDNPTDGRILVCNACFRETNFAYGQPFNVKDMQHTDDCWVSRARRIVGEE